MDLRNYICTIVCIRPIQNAKLMDIICATFQICHQRGIVIPNSLIYSSLWWELMGGLNYHNLLSLTNFIVSIKN